MDLYDCQNSCVHFRMHQGKCSICNRYEKLISFHMSALVSNGLCPECSADRKSEASSQSVRKTEALTGGSNHGQGRWKCTFVHLLSLVEKEACDRMCYSTSEVHRVLGNNFCLCERGKLYFRMLIGIASFLGQGKSRRKVKPWDWRDYSQIHFQPCIHQLHLVLGTFSQVHCCLQLLCFPVLFSYQAL